MGKSKGASTLKGSNLQASKGVRSKKGRGNQTNKRQTPAQRNIAKSPGQKHPQLSPNLSCILRNPESRDDEHDEYYGQPLHSTAVFSGESELNDEENENGAECPVQKNKPGKPTQQSVPLGGKIRTEKCALTRISEGVEAEKSEVNTDSANDEASNENAMESVKKQKKQSNKRAGASAAHSRDSSFHAEPCTETALQNNRKSHGQKRKKTLIRRPTGSNATPNSSVPRPATPEAGPSSVKIWCPEGMKRLTKDLTELDVVLDDFEEIVTEYKQSVEPNVCRKVIDRFFTDLKEQVTETISQGQELKNLEKKISKVMTTFNKTRKHFLVAQKELNEQEIQLKHLRKEYSELSQKKSDLQHATQFMSGFKQLQTQYLEHRNKNAGKKETYDISSLPALLIEARGILGAEKQLQIINTKLQQSLDKN
ncbi:centromere protein U isoform X4 [Heptranchias perlo]|uniref:centromere protein U isoform X4 n=1 Tax=Heptranchias perlo TaxID=212740 RepID=UPI00355A5FA2